MSKHEKGKKKEEKIQFFNKLFKFMTPSSIIILIILGKRMKIVFEYLV